MDGAFDYSRLIQSRSSRHHELENSEMSGMLAPDADSIQPILARSSSMLTDILGEGRPTAERENISRRRPKIHPKKQSLQRQRKRPDEGRDMPACVLRWCVYARLRIYENLSTPSEGFLLATCVRSNLDTLCVFRRMCLSSAF